MSAIAISLLMIVVALAVPHRIARQVARSFAMSGLRATVRVDLPDGFQVHAEIEVQSGETVALLGPNGAGKSTIVHVIAGVTVSPNSRVALDETDLSELEPGKRRVGLVFQDGLLFPNMTVRENIEFAARDDSSSLDHGVRTG